MPLIAMLAALFAPADAGAELRRRAYLTTTFPGVWAIDLGPDTGDAPAWDGKRPGVLGFSPDGDWMYGIEPSTGELLRYWLGAWNAPSVSALGLINPAGIVVTPDGLKAYVGLIGGNVAVINLADTPSIAATIPTAPVKQIAIAPNGAWVYVTASTGDLIRIDAATDAIAQSLPLGLTPSVGLDITPDGTRAVVTGNAPGSVQRVNLTSFTLEGGAIPVGGDPRNVVITPDGATALVADYEGRVLFIDLATATVMPAVTDLTHLNALGSIDIEPNGLNAWFFDSVAHTLYKLDVATRAVTGTLVLNVTSVEVPDINGKWIGKPAFYYSDENEAADVVNNDAQLTTLGFGREVIISGGGAEVHLAAGFTSARTFRFNWTPYFGVLGPVTLTGVLRGSGFELMGGGTLTTTGNYQVGPTDITALTTLQVDGTHNGSIIIRPTAVLRGTGTVGDLTVKGGSVWPGSGAGVGILTSGTTVFEGGSMIIDIRGTTPGSGYSQLKTLSVDPLGVDPPGQFKTVLGYAPAPGDTFTIMTGICCGFAEEFIHPIGAFAGFLRYRLPADDILTLQIHTAPTVSPIENKSIDEDSIYNGTVTIGDDLTPADNLTVTATSSNTTLVPNANIIVGPAGSVRSLQISPSAGKSGNTAITVRVSDPNWFTERTFLLTVGVVNAPTASPIGPQSTAEDTPTTPIALTVGDVETPVADLVVTATSSNQAIVPNANIAAGGSGANRTLTVTPAANAHGVVTITVRTSDGTAHVDTSFQLTVTPVNDRPTISSFGDRTIQQDSTTGSIPFTITDVDGFDGHTVTASSSNVTLVPNANANLTIGGAAGARTLTIVPAAGQHGTATITVTVNDGQAHVSTTFQLRVNAPPGTPISYYLAEGATGPFFDTDLLLANPNPVAAPVTVTWLLEGGGTLTQSRTLAPLSRTTIRVDDITGLEAATFSTMVTSTEGRAIAVERTMRWGDGGYGAHTEKATDAGATTWYFAEGAAGYFSTYLLLGNPHATANTAHVTWLREGEPVLTRSYPLLPNSRITIDTRADAELLDRAFGAKVVFDQPGVAERAMYFGADPLWSGGHGAAGQTGLGTQWDFAEGATGTYFTTFLLLANPGDAPADVTLTFFPEGGTPVTASYTLAAGQRMTRNIAGEHPSLENAAVAARVTSTAPIVAERAQYWGVPAWIDSHSSFGVTAPGRRWALAEGRVGGDDGAQTYILLSNPGDSAGTATLTFLRTDGTTVVKTVDVPAASRVTVGVTGDGAVPELVNESFGTLIESTQPIIVERSLYTNVNGITWAAGTNATAAALPMP